MDLNNKDIQGKILDLVNDFLDHLFISNKLTQGQRDLITSGYKTFIGQKSNQSYKHINENDVLNKLTFSFKNWDLVEPALNYKKIGRSYLSFLIEERNKWAHNEQISKNDLEYLCQTALRLTSLANDCEILQKLEEIFEFLQTSKSNINPNKDEIKSEDVNNQNFDGSTAEIINTIEKIQETDRRTEEIKKEDIPPLVYSKNEFINEFISFFIYYFDDNEYFDDDDYHDIFEGLLGILLHWKGIPSEILRDDGYDNLADFVEGKRDWIKNSEDENIINDEDGEEIEEEIECSEENDYVNEAETTNEITVEPGKYPGTLHFSDGTIDFAYGYQKLALIITYFPQIIYFVQHGVAQPDQHGYFKGHNLICLPNANETIVSFGKTKAKIFSKSVSQIWKWLEENHKENLIDKDLLRENWNLGEYSSINIKSKDNVANEAVSCIAEYEYSRLCFKADVIEPLSMDDKFCIVTPHGTFAMTKREFYNTFRNVIESDSYQLYRIYHYPNPPQKAMKFKVV